VLEGYQDQIPGKVFDLKFRMEIGYDRLTLKKYFGNNKRAFFMNGSGKKMPMRGEHEPGAFEKFGLVERIPFNKYSDITLAWKITPYFWIKLKEIYPQRKIAEFNGQQQYEGLGVQKEGNISLIPILQGKECEKTVLEVVSPIEATASTATNNNNNNSERYKNYGEPSPCESISKHTEYALTPEEYSILHSAIVERDRVKCVDCGLIDQSNPYRLLCPKGKGERSRYDMCVLEGEANG
jgi:hypothetical protein